MFFLGRLPETSTFPMEGMLLDDVRTCPTQPHTRIWTPSIGVVNAITRTRLSRTTWENLEPQVLTERRWISLQNGNEDGPGRRHLIGQAQPSPENGVREPYSPSSDLL